MAGTLTFWAAMDNELGRRNIPKLVTVMTWRQHSKGIAHTKLEFGIKGKAVVSRVDQCIDEYQSDTSYG